MSVIPPFSYSRIPWESRKKYLRDIVDRPSDRRIINIVKATSAPETPRTTKALLDSYVNINPATNGYSVQKRTSGRDQRRVSKRYGKIRWNLPGHGAVGNPENCGVSHGAEACSDRKSNKIVYRPKRWFCDRPTCPHCFEHWTVTTAAKKMMLIKGARRLFELYGARYRLCHVMISLPPESCKVLGDIGGYDRVKEDFFRVCDYLDMHGIMVFHPYRGKKDTLTDKSLIAPVNFDADYWRWGPHVHCVCFCDPDEIKAFTASLYDLYGVIVKVIAEDLNDDGAQNVIEYALTHTGVGEWEGHKNLRTIIPFGKLATSKEGGIAKLCEIEENVPLRCSECGGLIYDTRELDTGVIDEFSKNNTVKLNHSVYVRRDQLEGYRLLTAGMDDAQLMDFAHAHNNDVALILDPRQTVIEAECDISLLIAQKVEWSPPPRTFKGQTSLFGDHTQRAPGPPSTLRRASIELMEGAVQ